MCGVGGSVAEARFGPEKFYMPIIFSSCGKFPNQCRFLFIFLLKNKLVFRLVERIFVKSILNQR